MKAIVFAGGLALIWNDKIVMRCLWKDDRIICYEVERDEGMEKLRFTAYGPPYYKEKVNFQNNLENKVMEPFVPWMLMGD